VNRITAGRTAVALRGTLDFATMEAFASLPLDSPFFRTGLSSEAPVQAPPSAMPLSATPPPLSGFASPDAALQPQSMPTFPMPASEPLPERRFAQEPRQSAKWTEDEDAALKAAVEVNGPKSWKKVSQVVGTRSSALFGFLFCLRGVGC